ncbi:MAG: hypothetical protein PHR66_12830, partial [Desulfuromonadaceae bacterium]|nr:hypothetical protein [Desulfuromonadaceae bacterium]
MASTVATITDIRGLVTQGENAEEILKDRDPISENGGLLTISEFAKVVFADGREIDIQGPAQVRLDETFFQNTPFTNDTTVIDDTTVPTLQRALAESPAVETFETTLNIADDARGGVATEQLDTTRNAEQTTTEIIQDTTSTTTPQATVSAPVTPTNNIPTNTPDTPVPPTETADQKNVTIALSGDATVIEGESATYTVSTSLPTYTDLSLSISYQTIDASTGDFITHTQTVVIKAGETSATFTVDAVDDFYSDNGEKYQVSISNPVGGYRSYDIVTITEPTVTTEILDGAVEPDGGVGPADTVIATLSSVATLEGGSISYTITLTDTNGQPAVAASNATVTLANGEVVLIQAGQSSATILVPAESDDVYIDAKNVTNSISKVDGGGFENFVISTDNTITTQVSDTLSDVTVKLSATGANEAGAVVFTASLVDANGNTVVAHNDVTVTLSNGQNITIAANTSSGTVGYTQGDDVYVDGETLHVKITNASEANGGSANSFENLKIDSTEATPVITDTINDVTVKLSATGANEAGAVVFTASLVDANGNTVVAHNDVTVTLS